jgi:hypothetical protein
VKIDTSAATVTIELSRAELRLLRRALERASFIDTPQALEALPGAPRL